MPSAPTTEGISFRIFQYVAYAELNIVKVSNDWVLRVYAIMKNAFYR